MHFLLFRGKVKQKDVSMSKHTYALPSLLYAPPHPYHTSPPPPPAAWHELSESHVDFFINKEFYKLIEVLLSFLLIFSFKFLMEMKKMSPGYVV